MSDIVLSLRNATKLYAGVPAIENVDFELRRGEIHALVGENGAGKSTLTKVMAGVVTLTSGTMQVNGAAARLVHNGDTIIVVSYAHYAQAELEGYAPRVVHVEANTNRIITIDDEVATLLS